MKISACILAFLLLFYSITSAVFGQISYHFPEASEGQINEAVAKIVPIRWLPSHPLYFLIRVRETFSRALQPSSAKRAGFDFVLSGKRLKEAYLLLENGDLKNTGKSLNRYSSKLADVGKQLEKARSQNQDIAALTAEMSERFKNHEVLLYAISKKSEAGDLDEVINASGDSFVNSIMVINNILPGVKDRYKTITNAENIESSQSAMPTPSPLGTFQASPSARPKRIIY